MDYIRTYDSQIFQQSQCIWHENSLVDLLRSLLSSLGYDSIDERRFVWKKAHRRVFLAIVDDLEHLNYQGSPDFFASLTSDDTIITDNWFNRPLNARVLALPDSWFGIYASRPYIGTWEPSKRWCMPVNRIDYNRMMLLLELHSKGMIDSDCLVHFNCARHTDAQDTQDQKDLWQTNWENFDRFYQDRYTKSFQALSPLMPFSNHELEFDQMIESGLVQVVLETYVSDHSVALSEKTFRALVTPRLWRVFGGTWAVARLRSLGFDVLDDVVYHDTDGLKMIEDKVSKFVKSCHVTWSQSNWQQVEGSCKRARDHNQDLLETWRARWPKDFSLWLPGVLDQIS